MSVTTRSWEVPSEEKSKNISEEVVDILLDQYVGRRDVVGITYPGETWRVVKLAGLEDLRRALWGHASGWLSVGTFLLSEGLKATGAFNKSRSVVWDIDSAEYPDVVALEACVVGGFETHYTGNRFHVWQRFPAPVPAEALRRYAFSVIEAAAPQGSVEVFPKQDYATLEMPGNLIRLPYGKHNKTGKWSKQLTYTGVGDPKTIIDRGARAKFPELPPRPRPPVPGYDNWIKALDEGIPKGTRNQSLNRLCFFLNKLDLNSEVVEMAVRWYNDNRAEPPLSDEELVRTVLRDRRY